MLVQLQFTTSETKLDIWYNKPGIQVASRVSEQLKTEDIGKLQNI